MALFGKVKATVAQTAAQQPPAQNPVWAQQPPAQNPVWAQQAQMISATSTYWGSGLYPMGVVAEQDTEEVEELRGRIQELEEALEKKGITIEILDTLERTGITAEEIVQLREIKKEIEKFK